MTSKLLLFICLHHCLAICFFDFSLAQAQARAYDPEQSLGNWGVDPVPFNSSAAEVDISAADPCSVVNGGCQHICIPTPTSRVCSCWPGYYLEKDGRNCYDMVTARDGAAYCIDMSEKKSLLPRDSSYVQWMSRPKSNRRGCSMQGVVRIRMPPWAKQLWFNLAFSKTVGFSFHIADSENNAANRKRKSADKYDAEVFGLRKDVTINKNQYGTKGRRGRLVYTKNMLLSHVLQVRIWQNHVFLYNYASKARTYSGQLMRLNASIEDDYIYLGLNRIVNSISGKPVRRGGRGLCHACIYFR